MSPVQNDATRAVAERIAPTLPPGWLLIGMNPSTILDWSRGVDVMWTEVEVRFGHQSGIEVEMTLRQPPAPEWLVALLVASEAMPLGTDVRLDDWRRRTQFTGMVGR